jgi:hypothetical protein
VADLVKAHNQEGVQGEGRVRSLKLFSRRTKRASTDSHQSMSTSVTSPRDFNLPNSKEPEIDEEGYSIRPVDADRITGFHQEAQSSSDSDSDEDNRKKFRSLTIKSRDHVKTATDEELKSIKLQGPGGPGASLKLGSSTSLDVLERRGGRDSKDGCVSHYHNFLIWYCTVHTYVYLFTKQDVLNKLYLIHSTKYPFVLVLHSYLL